MIAQHSYKRFNSRRKNMICTSAIFKESLCSENSGENRPSPQHKRQHICSVCKIYFLTGKNMAVLSELILQNGHIFLHQQSHKIMESEDTHANEGRQKRTLKTTNIVTQRLFCACIGYELIRREAAISFRRG